LLKPFLSTAKEVSMLRRLVSRLGLIPGHLIVTEREIGTRELFAMLIKIAWAFRGTAFYLLRKKGIRATLKFLYVKLFVPGGEGSGGAALFLIGPLIKRFPRLAPYPRYIEMEVITVCNRKCILCEHTYWNEENRHLSFEEFKHIVDQFPKLKWTNLTGEGSAFLNRDYIKMIRYLKEKDIPVYLVDHLDSIDKETARELVEIGVDGIYVSIDGATKETYEKIKVGCNFDRMVQNLNYFLELKKEMKSPIPVFCFRLVVNTLNVHEMPQFIELVSSFGNRELLGAGSYVDFAGLLDFPEIKHLKVDNVPQEILKATIAKMREHDVHVVFAHTEVQKLPPLESCLCWMEPYIMMRGYVVPCCSVLMSNRREWLREHSLGNVFDKPFNDIWYSERYKAFRKLINRPQGKVPLLCLGCRSFDTTEGAKKYGVDMEL